MTINELLYDAIKYEETFLAYSLYWAMKKGYCQPLDKFDDFDASRVDPNEVNELIELNPLGIQTMKLYSMPTKPDHHLIVLAENEASAKGAYLNQFGVLPKLVVDMTVKMDTTFWHGKDVGYKTFRQIRDETLMFPCVVMEYDKTTQKWRN